MRLHRDEGVHDLPEIGHAGVDGEEADRSPGLEMLFE
jgi:hypothetical protein